MNVYVFIICPPFSGSTLLERIISTAPHVSNLGGHEGQWIARRYMPTATLDERANWTVNEAKFAGDESYDWQKIKRIWHGAWDLAKPVLVEKSPPNVLRAKMLQREFPNSRFILSFRNPYATIQAISQHNDRSIEDIAEFCGQCARIQMQNEEDLKNGIFISYEALTGDPSKTKESLQTFIPEAGPFDTQRTFHIKHRVSAIRNMNQEYIEQWTPEEIRRINSVLLRHRKALKHWGYDLI